MKNMIKMVILSSVIMVALSLFYPVNVDAVPRLSSYRRQARQIEKQYGLHNVIDTSKLTYGKIVNRKNTVIIERCIGKVVTENLDGKIMNVPKDKKQFNYINYGGVEGVKQGDVIVTYLLWNPENNADDDIVARWDFVLKK